MERAPLRPVPARPAGPVDPAAAIREVGAALPTLTPLEARAFALVALADRPRPQVAEVLGIELAELGPLLAAARKELRQTITPLGGSGWCERAEGLISDRLDGAVPERDARCLDVHLRNCPRCVDHERRLVQATDALLAGVAPLAPRPGPVAPPTELLPVPADESAAEHEALKEGASDAAASPSASDAPPSAPDAPGAPDSPGAPDAPAAPASLPPASGQPASRPPASDAAPPSDQIAAATEVLATARTRRQLAAAVTWNAMIAIALLLTIASIGLIIAGILGAQV
jgi:Putative zinc-finger